jgi:hopanoid biosynthesis associated protein HpnK
MPCRLIINADDFGLTLGINRAVGELHRAGVLTSATLMASGPAFEDAVALALSLPTLGVGCHIQLVDGTPVLPPEQIRTLIGRDGKSFRPTLAAFVRDLLLRRIDPAEIAREALAQVRRLQEAGIAVTHVDTHKHTHVFPAVARELVGVMRQTSVAALRNPFEPGFARDLRHAPAFRRLQMAGLNGLRPAFTRLTRGALTPDGTIGISATGTLTAYTLHQLLRTLPTEGTYELCCHPGYADSALDQVVTRLRHHRDVERGALLQEVPGASVELIHYGEL